jgi:hypothetical protein
VREVSSQKLRSREVLRSSPLELPQLRRQNRQVTFKAPALVAADEIRYDEFDP